MADDASELAATETLSTATFRSHLHELFQRLLAGFGLCVLAALPLAALATRLLGGGTTITADGFLWGILGAIGILNYTLLINVIGFVLPGLYRRERRILIVPAAWFTAAPFVTLYLVKLILDHTAVFGGEAATLNYARAWIIRCFLITVGVPLMLYLPKGMRGLSTSVYVLCITVLLAVPDEACDTLIVALYCCAILATLIAALGWVVTSWQDWQE
jgi:hypothetical protein